MPTRHQYHEETASTQLKRIQQWIERLEGKAIALLDGLEIEEMTPKHQADVAFKCLDHVQRLTLIEQKLQDATQAHDNQDMLAQFKRAARGELELSEIPDDQPTTTNLSTAGAGERDLAPTHEPQIPAHKLQPTDLKQDAPTQDDIFVENHNQALEEHTMTEAEKRQREIDEEYDRLVHDEEFWEWLEQQILQWKANTYSEDEEYQEDDSWLNNDWSLDQGDTPWDEY